MTTTTTNTNSAIRPAYNRPAIFRRAWDLVRSVSNRASSAPASFGDCLRRAWAEAKGIPEERIAARELLHQWAALDDAGKHTILACNCHVAARETIRYAQTRQEQQSGETVTVFGYATYAELPAFVQYGINEIDELINETVVSLLPWLDEDRLTALNEKRAAEKGLAPITLSRLIVRCGKSAVSRMANAHRKHSVASVRESGEDGSSFLETCCGDSGIDIEGNAALRDILERLYKGSDENGRAIIDGLREGLSEREIAAGLKISNVAVHKRIVKLREALKALLAA